jgi:uncharacterized protein
MSNRWISLLFLPLVASSCGGEAESAPGSRAAAFGQPLNPWDTIPADSLYGATPVENLRITPVELHVLGIPPGWEGMRIAAISDLQLDLWSGNAEVAAAAVAAAAASGPDIVVLLGDYLGDGADASALPRLFAPLQGIPTFAVLGDRDVRSDSLAARVAAALSNAGIHVLRNEAITVGRGGDTASVVGVDAELAGESAADQQWILSQLGVGRPVGLLIAHNPILAARADEDRVPAAVAGGTFCGRVEIPGTPRLTWLNAEALPFAVVEDAERLYRIGSMVLFVTCGTGYGFVPVRFGAPPEVALITLRSVGAPEEEAAAEPDTLMQQFEESLGDTAR